MIPSTILSDNICAILVWIALARLPNFSLELHWFFFLVEIVFSHPSRPFPTHQLGIPPDAASRVMALLSPHDCGFFILVDTGNKAQFHKAREFFKRFDGDRLGAQGVMRLELRNFEF